MQLERGQVKCRVRRSLRDVRDSQVLGWMSCKWGGQQSHQDSSLVCQLHATNEMQPLGL